LGTDQPSTALLSTMRRMLTVALSSCQKGLFP
jgi:hypothetical protein